jgi:uncharacterized protein YjcR
VVDPNGLTANLNFPKDGNSSIFDYNKTIKVMTNKYQKSPLSLIEGGSRIKITFKNGIEREYDNIKDVSAYVAKVLSESDYMINRIEMEKEVVTTTKEWSPLFGRSRYGTYGSESHSYNAEI